MTPADLRALRERLGLTQVQLAERLGVPQPAVSYWESGTRPIPPYIVKLLDYLAKEPPR